MSLKHIHGGKRHPDGTHSLSSNKKPGSRCGTGPALTAGKQVAMLTCNERLRSSESFSVSSTSCLAASASCSWQQRTQGCFQSSLHCRSPCEPALSMPTPSASTARWASSLLYPEWFMSLLSHPRPTGRRPHQYMGLCMPRGRCSRRCTMFREQYAMKVGGSAPTDEIE